ncbi:MAG TPA: tyrosine-type recombinase/integrase [Pirellulales bacterium]|jgi:integrase|nr:tyrosine-type recombinase/integrase [Pirellulales bacterium]
MISRKSTTAPRPYKDFPLFRHATGQWAKKIRGRLVYFGIDAERALDKYLKHKDELLAGLPINNGKVTVKQLVNQFLTSKKAFVDSGELSKRTFDDYYVTCERVLIVFGKSRPVESLRPLDFERLRAKFATTHGPVRLCKDITCVRVLANYAYKADLIEHPVKCGNGFDKPSKSVLRRARKPKMFTAPELRKVIESAGPQLKAMIYLGLNCGFGNSDCARLTIDAVDLRKGWIIFPRPKTGIDRRVPLWPETIKALKAAIADRPKPKVESNLVFVTKYGHSWDARKKPVEEADENERAIKDLIGFRDNPISKEMRKLLDSVGVHRKGVGFYALRHVFQTIGEKTRDKDAVRAIMGHVENSIAANYSEESVDDDRLIAVVNFVRTWLRKTR